MKHPMYDTSRQAYNRLTVNLTKAVNEGRLPETIMLNTLRLVNSGGDDWLIQQILNDGGKTIIEKHGANQ